MFSEVAQTLFTDGSWLTAVGETLLMTLLSTAIAYMIGLPLGVLLVVTGKGGIRPIPWLNATLSVIVNIFRSIPFIILMVAFLPVAKAIVGKSYGNAAMVVMLVIAAAPYIARMVESSLREVDAGVIEAAEAMGSTRAQIVFKVLIPEAKPSLIIGAVISTVTVLGYSAMAATIAAGGLGAIAITWGHQRGNKDVIWIAVALTVILVQILQEIGMRIAKVTDKRNKKRH